MEKCNRSRKQRGADTGGLSLSFLLCGLSVLFLCMLYASAGAVPNIEITKHNLSVSGTGTFKSGTETRICVFCHTPHNASPMTPLWNKEIQPQTYSVYESTTLRAPQPLPQPTGSTKLCLSCHDGTIALGTVVSGANLGLGATLPTSSPAYFGLDLSTHHPVSFSYSDSLPYPELADPAMLPAAVRLSGLDTVQCTSCHNPHDDSYGMFLSMDNRYSALCLACHTDQDWSASGHATSTDPVAGILPVSPKTWPNWPTVAEWGCGVCHWPHFAQSAPLLNFASFDYCLECHSSIPGGPYHVSPAVKGPGASIDSPRDGIRADIKGQVKKKSGHHMQPATGMKKNRLVKGPQNVTCADCHNLHKARRQNAVAPYVSGMLRGVSGVDRNGIEVKSAKYEYEICFKCHGDYSVARQYMPRVVPTNNLRLAFDPGNPSYHPVMETGKDPGLASLTLRNDFSASSIMYCTDCHRDDDEVSKGPHGSSYSPILMARYETDDGTRENADNYALCYRCHDRTSILRDDSFRRGFSGRGGHSGHLAAGASCAVCHDPHGVVDDGATGSHTHLINFDMRAVRAKTGNIYPIYTDRGKSSGSCTLVCHGKLHDGLAY